MAREESADACRRLAVKCSEGEAIEKLVLRIFEVFHGAEGKLIVADHKISVLQGAGNLSYNNVTGNSKQRIAAIAGEQFLKVLNIEGKSFRQFFITFTILFLFLFRTLCFFVYFL